MGSGTRAGRDARRYICSGDGWSSMNSRGSRFGVRVPIRVGMSTPAAASCVEKAIPCIARQPILTAEEKVVGYELFFREGPSEERFRSDVESATSATIDALNMVGLDVLCDGHPAFINCTHQMLLADYFALLPPADIVVEIQETVPPDEEVKRACERLKRAGYSIALDNFVPDDGRESLVPFADFIKIDTRAVSTAKRADLAAQYASEERRMLAQKVGNARSL